MCLPDLIESAEMVATRALMSDFPRDGNGENLSDDERDAQDALRRWQVYSHDPGRADAERERLLTSLGGFSNELTHAVGFDAHQADAILGAFDLLALVGIRHIFDLASYDAVELMVELADLVAAEEALKYLPPGLGEHLSFNRSMISYFAEKVAGTALPPSALDAFLSHFSLDFGAIAEGSPRRRLWDVRERPLLHDGNGNYMWTVLYDLVFAVRPVCERAIRDQGGPSAFAYDKAKAKSLEDEAMEVLHNGLTADGSWRTLHYPHHAYPDQDVEGDGMVSLDTVALAIESKAVELSPSARHGSAKALAKKLQDTILQGAAQGQRTRDALLGAAEMTGISLPQEQRERIEISGLSRVIPIVAVLEPLGAVTSALWRLVDLPTSDAPWPWVVNIDDLRWFDRELGMPARLLHYALVRQRIASSGRLGATDEVDWFWMYFSQGAAAVYEKLDLVGYFTAERIQFVGPDVRRGGQLPAPLFVTANETLLDDLHRVRPPGWIEVAFALLDLPLESSQRLARGIHNGLRPDKGNSCTWLIEKPTTNEGSLLLVGTGPDDRLQLELAEQLDAVRRSALEDGIRRVCALTIDRRDREPTACTWEMSNSTR